VIFIILLVFGPAFVFAVWIPIVNHRGHMVACAQLLLVRNRPLDEPPFTWLGKVAKDSPEHNQVVASQDYKDLVGGPTRFKLDLVIPWAFAFLWLGILVWWMIGGGTGGAA
jgi:hypothetical protein